MKNQKKPQVLANLGLLIWCQRHELAWTLPYLDVVFRRYRDKAKLSGFTCRDSRHTAATRIAQKLHGLDLCKMFGWTELKRAMIRCSRNEKSPLSGGPRLHL